MASGVFVFFLYQLVICTIHRMQPGQEKQYMHCIRLKIPQSFLQIFAPSMYYAAIFYPRYTFCPSYYRTHFAVNPFKFVLPHWLRTVVFYSSPLLARLFLFINYDLLKSLSLRLIHATRNRLPILCFPSLLLHHIWYISVNQYFVFT